MRSTLAALAALVAVLPGLAFGGAIVKTSFSVFTTEGLLHGVCGTDEGEFNASADGDCGNGYASASAGYDGDALFWASVSGAGGGVFASASFDFPVLVTGTSEPGFLRIFLMYDHNPIIVGPSVIQSTTASFDGVPFDHGNFRIVSIPYLPGVPIHVTGSIIGVAGAADVPMRGGMFSGRLTAEVLGVARREAPKTDDYPDYIAGASWVVIPEPSTILLMLTGLAGLLLSGAQHRSAVRRPARWRDRR